MDSVRNCDERDLTFRLPITRKLVVEKCPIKYLDNYYLSIYKMIKTIFGGMGSSYTAKDYLNELAVVINLKDVILGAEAEYDENKFKKESDKG